MEISRIRIVDDFLPPSRREEIYQHVLHGARLGGGGWEWGWKSNTQAGADQFRFWHKHYAGQENADRRDEKGVVLNRGSDCAAELQRYQPLVWCMWDDLSQYVLKGHVLVRCYANGFGYGDWGTLHTDSVVEGSYTTIYYPHARWSPNWGGETVFFKRMNDHADNDIVGVVWPRPGRLCVFPGTMPHVARGVSRSCPVLRVTLMFKTECLAKPDAV